MAYATPVASSVDCGLGALEDPQPEAEVVVQDRDLASLSGLIGKQDRLAHILGSSGVSDVHARRAEVAERARRRFETELLRQPQRAAGNVDR